MSTQERDLRAALRHPLPQSSRYELLLRIASGGMASVYLGRLKAAAGFWKLRAIKRAHPHLAEDEGFRRRLVEEAQLSSRIDNPHVVSMQDVEEVDGELLLVMDYVEGASLSELFKKLRAQRRSLPVGVALRIVLDACTGLTAAHELVGDDGMRLGLVHRDVSPQNVLVGIDGLARIADFGIAKCVDSPSGVNTRTGALKGKIGYMSPEYVKGRRIDARADVFALGVVTWEALAGEPLFRGENELHTLHKVCAEPAPRLSEKNPALSAALDAAVARALQKSPAARFASVRAFAEALSCAIEERYFVANRAEVGALVAEIVGEELERRRRAVRQALDASARTEEPADGASGGLEDGTIDRSVVVTSSGKRSLPAASRPRSRRWSLAVVLGLLAASGAAAAVFGSRASREPEQAPASAPELDRQEAPSASPPPPERPEAAGSVSGVAASATSEASSTPVSGAVPVRPRIPAPRPKPAPAEEEGPDPNPYR